MKSLTYYLTLLVIRLKGIKKEFSKDPIDYKKLRKEDVHQPEPSIFKGSNIKQFKITETQVTEIIPLNPNGQLVIFCHGGAFIYGPVDYHWEAAQKIVSKVSCCLWLIDYPKAPENKIFTISQNIDKVYSEALKTFDAGQIIFLGDSVGGTLLISLTQRLIKKNNPKPAKLILLSPVVDATLKNPEIEKLDPRDPILSRKGVLSAKRMCAGEHSLNDPIISPVKGSFDKFPETILFLAENDITFPDQKIMFQKMKQAGVKVKMVYGSGMPHIWPLLPVMKEGKEAFSRIVSEIKTITG